jgi:hypothetical protein
VVFSYPLCETNQLQPMNEFRWKFGRDRPIALFVTFEHFIINSCISEF